jgi:hypothetical protein
MSSYKTIVNNFDYISEFAEYIRECQRQFFNAEINMNKQEKYARKILKIKFGNVHIINQWEL